MNTRQNFEIKAVATALTVSAALTMGMLSVRDANAAPPKKKSTVTVKRATKSKPVYVKMTGSRRAATARAERLYADAITQKEADAQAAQEQQLAVSQTTQNNGPNNTESGAATNPSVVVGQGFGYGNGFGYSGLGGFNSTVVGGYGQGAVGVGGNPITNIYGGGYSNVGYPNSGYGNIGYPNVGYPSNGFSLNTGGSSFGFNSFYGF